MTLANAGLALFTLALYRFSGQDDLCIGMSVANRSHPDLESLIGFFVNIVPIRTRLAEDMDLDTLLAEVARTATDALERQDYPFDLLVRRLRPARVATRQPLVNVVYAFQNFTDVNVGVGARPPGAGPGEPERFEFVFGTSKFDLTLFVADEGDTLRLMLEYDTGLFYAGTARRFLALLDRFVRTAVRLGAAPAP
jgi:non-ribosomal peptide synthetase component F